MPPFSNWWLFLIPKLNVILDIRDGWSIAMKTGYGGTSNPQPIKSFIAKKIETYVIKRSPLTITCTPGLQKYLTEISPENILLITNGYSQSDQEIVDELLEYDLSDKEWRKCGKRVAVCVGQFSEYGQEKVKKIIAKLDQLYPAQKIKIKLIGSDVDKNKWLNFWLLDNNYFNITVEIFSRMSRKEMYKTILQSDVGLTVIRDPNYEFGTKIFDYILCKTPVLNYFDEENSFTDFFKSYFSVGIDSNRGDEFNRNYLIENNRKRIIGVLLDDC